ncbi:hypothetical protein [uncultured Thiohalocapsa sp.]|uniref:hypothetical protein n=1 Tax=uncultured Thiohalocapsa sp. TaxID=768990 RepID=UPI0025FA4CB1|nr:hypothetical protein [uncultured Thiohalocapsa sp.]
MTTQPPNAGTQATADAEPLWQLVPIADYRLPQTPAAGAARARWASLRRLFAPRRKAPEAPARTEADLRGLTPQRLDALAGPVDWTAGAAALDQQLGEDADGVWLLIGPPHSGHGALLHAWAAGRGAQPIEPPGDDAILSGDRAWLDAWPRDARPWLLPRLEQCWLRHAAGLALVRALLTQAQAGRLGHGIIGCDSWAWAYLRQVAALPTRRVLTLQACDGEGLATLFRALVAAHVRRPLRFRHAHSGKPVLVVDGAEDAAGATELQYLAARCRGNAGLARALWRSRLRAEPDADGEDAGTGTADDGTSIWVAAATEPSLAAGPDETVALVLHALLLHNGLPGPLLAELLPLPAFRVEGVLQRLAAAGAIAEAPAGDWRLTAAGYAPARDLLKAQGFLLDDF